MREQSRFRPAVHNPQYFGWLAKHYGLLDGTSNLFIKPSTVRHDHLRATADGPSCDDSFVSRLVVIHQKEGENMGIAPFKPRMQEVLLDTEVFEERFAEYDIINEFTGIIFTLEAVENNVRYVSFVTASYAEVLRKQQEAIA